jgi:hypothetical protein
MGKIIKPMIIRQLIENVKPETEKVDSMVLSFGISTKGMGVKEQKVYLDYLKPEECRLKIKNMLSIKNYANALIEAPNSLLEPKESE